MATTAAELESRAKSSPARTAPQQMHARTTWSHLLRFVECIAVLWGASLLLWSRSYLLDAVEARLHALDSKAFSTLHRLGLEDLREGALTLL